ncbi:MAG TPA: NPCBM/NEW2 domain-containing protein [Jatrophihabitans sp.]|jgi:alpha-galactosidase|nr:NPCBM/NEW2 domain-containing protein [Jatrophihabitans sp.]
MRRLIALAVAASVWAAATLAAFGTAQSAAALDNGLARTPYLGWNTYYGLGSSFDEQTIESVADALVERGLAAAGYKYVWLDGGWWDGSRDADGNITVDASQWPHGLRAVTDYIHAKGLLAGIYTDAGEHGCGGNDQGSYGHYQQDADQFAAWGFDAVKVDFCGGTAMHLDPATAYGQFRDALLHNASGRPMLFNICNPFTPDRLGPGDPPFKRSVYNSYSFGPSTGNSWRTDTDVGFVHSIQWPDVLRNLDHDAAHPEAAGPGHWNDPDYLGPELGMTADQARAQFTMWSMVAAPLIIGSDVRSLAHQTIDMLTNAEVLAVDQDSLGVQGTRIAHQGDGDVWVKPLANGDRAVALLNRGSTPLTISTTARAVGLPRAAAYGLHDLWSRQTTATAATIAATVPPGSATLFRVSPDVPAGTAPATSLGALQAPSTPGAQQVLAVPGSVLPVSTTFRNDGREPVDDARLRLAAPPGWNVGGGPPPSTVAPGQSVSAHWQVQVPAGALPGSYGLHASASYVWGGTHRDTRTSDSSVQVPSTPPSGAGYLSDQSWLAASSGWRVPMLDQSVGTGPIRMLGTTYPKGLGVASVSRVDYYLGGNCTELSGVVGIDDAVNFDPTGGTAQFRVVADGAQRYDTGVVDRHATHAFDVDLTGVQVLSLQVGDGGDNTYNDRADWAGLQLTCGAAPGSTWPDYVPQRAIKATATSAHDGYPASSAVDGQLATIWHDEFSPQAPLPQAITLDLGAAQDVSGLTYQPRLDGTPTGTVTGYQLEVSSDGSTFQPVASGMWPDDSSLKSVTFAAHQVRYVRLVATAGDGGYASAAEIDIATTG